MALTSIQKQDAYKFFIVAFGAPTGVEYMNQLDEAYGAGMTTKQIVNVYTTKPQFEAQYPRFLTNEQFADKLIENVVGASATAAAKAQAKADVASSLNAGWSKGDVVFQIFSNLAAKDKADPEWGATAQMLVNKAAVAEYLTETLLVNTTDLTKLASYIANVTADIASVEAAKGAAAGANGGTFMLTKGLDTLAGQAGNDTFIGSISGEADLNTLSALDSIDGGAGVDTLKIADDKGTAITLPNIKNVEVVEVQGTKGIVIDTTSAVGVTNLNVVKAVGAVDATAGATTDISVALKEDNAAASLANAVKGGKNVTVTATDLGVATADAAKADKITVGGAGSAAAAGDVVVNATGAKSVAATNKVLSAVEVTGGKTVSVTQKATSDASAAAADKTGATITQGAVTITGNTATTAVTVKQDASVAAVAAVDAKAAKAATQEVTFAAMTKGQTVVVDFGDGSLTFTANKALTAAEAASAFANLAAGAKQGSASVALGIYADATAGGATTGVTNGWTSGAVTAVSATAAKVTFTSATAASAAAITNGGGAVAVVPGAFSGDAVVAVAAKTGVLGVANGTVNIQDSGAGFIKTITVDGYGGSSVIGTTGATAVLETLNLSNSGLGFTGAKVSSAADITVAKTAATLALNLEKVGFSGYYNGDATTTTQVAAVTLTAAPTTLNVKSTGNNYVNLTAAATETLNVSGTGLLDASTTDLAALKTIKVTETAGLKLNAAVSNTVTSVDTTGTTGTVTVTIKGDTATYTGGAGVDNVSVDNASTAISKAIDLGAGNDRLDLSATLAIDPTVEIKGGDGTDTIVLSAAAAVARSGGVTFQDKITSFEKLEVGALGVASTVNLDNLDDINYVISTGAGGTKAVYTINLTGASLADAGDTLTIGGVTAITAAAAAADAVAVAALLPATITIGGVVYDINKTVPTAVTLTAQTASNVVANVTVAVTDVAGGGSPAAPTTATVAPTTNGVAAAAALLTLDKMLTGATVELKAAGDVEVKLGTDGAADVVNFVANAATGTTLGTATAHKVETINIEAKDTDVTTAVNATTGAVTANVSTNTLVLGADAAKTVNLTGAGNLTVTLSAATKEVTLIDGSTATGKLNVTTLASDTAATTVKGGSAADTLEARGANDVLQGGAGNDTLKVVGGVASAVTLTGGDGVDSFDVSGFLAANAGAAATITDFTKGETIKFANNANANFASSKVTLIAEATFDNYVTEAAKGAQVASGDGAGSFGIAWFQFGGNTFVVQDANIGAGTAGVFDNGNDIIVKLTGLVDLSASSFNEVGQGTLLYI